MIKATIRKINPNQNKKFRLIYPLSVEIKYHIAQIAFVEDGETSRILKLQFRALI